MSTPSLQDAYKVLSKASSIKVGDCVTVVAKAVTYQMGWGNSWVPAMDTLIAKAGIVTDVDHELGVGVQFPTGRLLYFPFFVLRVVLPIRKIVDLGDNGHVTIVRTDDTYKVFGLPYNLSEGDLVVISTAIRKFRKEVGVKKA